METLTRRVLEVSTLSEGDWIGMQATLHALDNERFQCSSCVTQFAGRPGGDDMLARSRASKACETPGTAAVFSAGDLSFFSCPGNYYDPSVLGVLSLHRQWESGMLPYPGSASEQPNKVMEAFRVVDAYRHVKQKEAAKKAQLMRSRRGR